MHIQTGRVQLQLSVTLLGHIQTGRVQLQLLVTLLGHIQTGRVQLQLLVTLLGHIPGPPYRYGMDSTMMKFSILNASHLPFLFPVVD